MSSQAVVDGKPRFSAEQCKLIARKSYGIEVSELKPLPSYDDQNFQISYTDETGGLSQATMKISNPVLANLEILDLQISACNFLCSRGIPVPQVLAPKDADGFISFFQADGKSYPVRLLTFLPGRVLAKVEYTAELMSEVGRTVGLISRSFQEFDHPAMRSHDHGWNLKNLLDVRHFADEVTDPKRKELAIHFIALFEEHLQPKLDNLRQGMTHHDCNEFNILVDDSGRRIAGIIDFGDIVYSALVLELCITVAYAILRQDDIEIIIEHVVRGYNAVMPLAEPELDVLYYGIAGRLVQSVLNSTHQLKLDPENEYVAISQEPAWIALEKLQQIGAKSAREIFDRAVQAE